MYHTRSPSEPQFTPDGFGGFWLTTPYFSARFVAELKTSLAKRYRRWNPERHCWWVSSAAVDEARRIAARHYGPVNEREERQYSPPPPPRRDTILEYYAALHLLPSAPAELVRAAYRALSKVYHPDHGGDTQKQVAINAAYEKLKEVCG